MSNSLSFIGFIDALSALTIGQVYKYASAGRLTSGYCELVSLDLNSGAIRYRRNGEAKIENIAGNNVEKLAIALGSRQAVEINALYGGSGNFRSALEALAANTEHVFVCQIDGKKHIFWDPEAAHPIGEVTMADPPAKYVPVASISATHTTSASENSVSRSNNARPDILAAIRTKPFVLLAGMSGTGKSRMVRELARGCCPVGSVLQDEQKPGNFEMVPVKPNWHDSTELLGYETRITDDARPRYVLTDFVRFLAKAWLFPEVPFFVCLDEMNLAPVEQYFAEYLSVVETRRRDEGTGSIRTDVLVRFPPETAERAIGELLAPYEPTTKGFAKAEVDALRDAWKKDGGIRIPPNLVVMGTVNMDETTFSFSRKVLDRAMSFELCEVDMREGLETASKTEFGSIPAASAMASRLKPSEFYEEHKEVCDAAVAFLEAVNGALEKTPFKVAYRTRDEVMLYCVERTKGGASLPQALDEAACMKVLSRVEGDQKRDGVLKRLEEAVRGALDAAGDGGRECTKCTGKLEEMRAQLGEGGYTSFWTR